MDLNGNLLLSGWWRNKWVKRGLAWNLASYWSSPASSVLTRWNLSAACLRACWPHPRDHVSAGQPASAARRGCDGGAAAAACDIYPQTKQIKQQQQQPKKDRRASRRRRSQSGTRVPTRAPQQCGVGSPTYHGSGAAVLSGPFKQAARRQRRAFIRDWGASAGGRVDTWHRRTAQRRRVNPASDEVCHTVKSTSPFLSLPSVSASHAQVAARYRKNPYKIKAWTSGWQAPKRWDMIWCI